MSEPLRPEYPITPGQDFLIETARGLDFGEVVQKLLRDVGTAEVNPRGHIVIAVPMFLKILDELVDLRDELERQMEILGTDVKSGQATRTKLASLVTLSAERSTNIDERLRILEDERQARQRVG